MIDCPKCGEHEKVNDYVERMPTGYNYYCKCLMCKATFNPRFYEYTKDNNPFITKEKEEDEEKMK